MEKAIGNHEFEKARFYSDEERKERDNLRQLKEKYGIDETPNIVPVTQADVDEVMRLRGALGGGVRLTRSQE